MSACRNRLVSVRRSRHGGDHPGGNLAISATRTLTVLNGFREMVGTTLRSVPPTPLEKHAAAHVEQATGVFARRSGGDGDHPGWDSGCQG